MSYSIDVNILLYASNKNCVEHERAAKFLQGCARNHELFCLAWQTIMAYLRISTHPAIFVSPLSDQEARRNIDALLRLSHVRAIGEQEGFWEIYSELAALTPARGNDVPDLHLATIYKQNDVTCVFTNDSDFRRFAFLRVRNPLNE
ncbi:MAG: PIN domain-containing protein [Deltaproteobacteria bacterium]|nr:PIN domain-containing protein [Deltaproteobacteria bacterium]